MKSKLPGLTGLVAMVLTCSSLLAQPAAPTAPAAAAETLPSNATAEQVLQAAIVGVERHNTISANLRHRANLFGHLLVGSGRYLQGPPRYNLLRLELNLQIGQVQSRLLHVCDGRFLWAHRDVAGAQALCRVDADRVRETWEQAALAKAKPMALDGLAMGGLPRLMRGLSESFRFTSIQDGQLGMFPVRILHGEWRSQRLVDLFPERRAAIEQGQPVDMNRLPQHVPDQVLLYLGRDDLFPYRFEYRCRKREKDQPVEPSGAGADTIMLATLELFEVQINAQIDTQQFVYNPGDQPFVDATDAFLGGQGLFAGPQ
jgi:hypothetical protein